LRHEDVSLGAGAHIRCRGKGRKERCTPLAKPTVAVLKAWIREQGREDSKTLFPSSRGGPLSADGVQHLLARHVVQARKGCASLGSNASSPVPSPRLFVTLQNILDHSMCSRHRYALVCQQAALTAQIGILSPAIEPSSRHNSAVFSSASARFSKTHSALQRAISLLPP
jgi:integrase